MAFVHPGLLWALTALAIPVLIHLFQLRRFKRLDFPHVRLLQEVSQRSRARRQVRHWLVLLARLAALSCLVLAFARPYLPSADRGAVAGQRAVAIYVDDSFSMDAENAGGRLLDQARAMAQDVVMAYDATDRFQVLTGRFEGREQLLLGREDALDAAGQVQAGPYVRPLSQAITRMREALANSDAQSQRLVLLSDLQRTITDLDAWRPDSTGEVLLVPISPEDTRNLSVDSAWFASPVRRTGQQEVLHVRIRNHGPEELLNVPLRLTVDGRERAVATFGAPPGAVVDTTLRFLSDVPGLHRAEVSVLDAPVRFDDRLHLAWTTAAGLDLLLLSSGTGEVPGEGDRSVEAVFAADSLSSLAIMPYRNVDLAELGRKDLVVLNGLREVPSGLAQELAAFVQGGGSLAVFPHAEADLASYTAALQGWGGGSLAKGDTNAVRVDRIDLDQPFYRDVFETLPNNVDLPVVRQRHRLRMPPGSDVLLRLQDGDPFLAAHGVGQGRIYVCAAPLSAEGGNFTRHALFVASLLRMAELSRPMGALYRTVGSSSPIPLDGLELQGDVAPHLRGPGGTDLVPEVRRLPGSTGIVVHDQDLPDGAYALTLGPDTLRMLAFNVDRRESDLSVWDPEALAAELEARGLTGYRVLDADDGVDLSLSLRKAEEGTELWKWFVIAALLFLALETLLLRPLRTR